MEGDSQARCARKKKKEDEESIMAAGFERDGKMKKKEEDGRSAQKSVGSKSEEKDGESSPKSGSSERKEEGDDEKSAPKSKWINKEVENGESVETRREMEGDSQARCARKKKKEDEESIMAAGFERDGKMKKKEEDGRSAQKSVGSKSEEKDGESSPKSGSSERKEEGDDEKSAPKSKWINKEVENGESVETRLQPDVLDAVSCLPDLVQDKIFEFLSLRDKARAAQVCSSWKGAVYRPCNWRRLTIKVKTLKMSKELRSSLKIRKISGLKLTTLFKGWKKILEKFHPLEYLDLSARNTAVLLKSLSCERFVSLKSLVLLTRNKWQMQSLVQSLQCFPNLDRLFVDGVVATCLLEAIGDQLKGLSRLELCRRNGKDDYNLNVESLSQLTRLQHLELSNFHLEGMEVLRQLSATLKKLIVWDCYISEVDWTAVLSQLGSLQELDIYDCVPGVDSDGLRLLAQTLPDLKRFSCASGMMTSRFIPEEDKMTDDHVSAVAGMASLQEVHLFYGHMITDAGLLELCARLKNLKALTVTECHQMTASSIEQISGLSFLTELRLENCKDGGNWLKILARGSCKLRKLVLADFDNSDVGMEDLAQMSSLQNLDFAQMTIGAIGMAHLNTATFDLESLEIVHCEVTVKGLSPLLQRQTSLRRLVLVEKTGTPETAVPYLKTFLPCLEKCSVFNWNPKEFDRDCFEKRLAR